MSTLCRNSTYSMNNFHSCRYMAGDSPHPSHPPAAATMIPGVDLLNCLSSMASNDVIDTSFQDESFDMDLAMAMLEADSLPDGGGGGGGAEGDLVAGYPSSVDTESPVSTPSPHYHPATPTYPHPNHFHFPEALQQHSPLPPHPHSPLPLHPPPHHRHMADHPPEVHIRIKREMDCPEYEATPVKSRRGPRRISRTDLCQEGPDMERKERRREQNRNAARRCRERKKVQRTAVIKEYYELVSANAELQSRIQHLEVEKNRLHDTLQRHRRSCSLQF